MKFEINIGGTPQIHRGVLLKCKPRNMKPFFNRLMSRTKDNPDLINAINGFLNALDKRSRFGSEDEPLSRESLEKLIEFFKDKAKELEFLVGNKPSS